MSSVNEYISSDRLNDFIRKILFSVDVREDVAVCVANGLLEASLRGVDSHGVRLLPHYVHAVKGGRINASPVYHFDQISQTSGIFDADHTFGHAAGMEASQKVIEISKKMGTAAVAVANSTHFGAAAYYTLEIAKHDMIGICFSNTDSLIRSPNGKRAFVGNNPLSISVPMASEAPLCLDMATSRVTFNKVKQYAQEGCMLEPGMAADKNGAATIDPNQATMLEAMGSYKGFGLSLMLEVFCSLLTGMPYGPQISKMFEAPLSEKRYLSHFLLAFPVDGFQPITQFKQRLTEMVTAIRSEPAHVGQSVQVPGDPEKAIFEKRSQQGIPVSMKDLEQFQLMAASCGVPFYLL